MTSQQETMECITALPDHAANFRAAFKKINMGMYLCLQAHVKCNMHSDSGIKQEIQNTGGILFVYSSVSNLRALFKGENLGRKSQPPHHMNKSSFPSLKMGFCLSELYTCIFPIYVNSELKHQNRISSHIQQIIWLTTCWLTCSF